MSKENIAIPASPIFNDKTCRKHDICPIAYSGISPKSQLYQAAADSL
jgi:hypothetical protein